jgi:hypothetical protein
MNTMVIRPVLIRLHFHNSFKVIFMLLIGSIIKVSIVKLTKGHSTVSCIFN